jgi:tetratricopeptide (TPR) repeat protein
VQRAAALEPDSTETLLAQANLARYRGQLVEMDGYFRKALARDENDSAIQILYARPLAMAGHLREAVEHANKAYALAPTSAVAAAELAEYYSRLGQEAESLKYVSIATDLGFVGTSAPLSSTAARAAFRARRYSDFAALMGTQTGFTVDLPDRAKASSLVLQLFAPTAGSEAAATRAALAEQFRKLSGGGCTLGVYALATSGRVDDAYKLVDRCSRGVTVLVESWTPEMRAFRQDPRFSNWITKLLPLEYWQKYSPPDDCELKDGKLSCH